jgi:hypothetical protein
MFCPSCGTDLPDQSKFCGSCGFQIPGDAPAPATPAATLMMAPGTPPMATPNAAAVPAPAGGPVPSVDDVIARGVQLPIGDAISQGWELMKPQMGLLIGGLFVLGLVGGLASNLVIGVFVLGPIYAGFDIVCLRLVAGRPVAFENFFDGFKQFVPFLILSLIRGAMIFGGYMLLVIPGIYLTIATMWAWNLHIDRGIEPWEAIKTSMKIVNSNFFGHFGFAFVMGLVAMLGMLACYVGALFTIPIVALGMTYVYKLNFGIAGGAERLKQGTV